MALLRAGRQLSRVMADDGPDSAGLRLTSQFKEGEPMYPARGRRKTLQGWLKI